jgi:hypothetical protein
MVQFLSGKRHTELSYLTIIFCHPDAGGTFGKMLFFIFSEGPSCVGMTES